MECIAEQRERVCEMCEHVTATSAFLGELASRCAWFRDSYVMNVDSNKKLQERASDVFGIDES